MGDRRLRCWLLAVAAVAPAPAGGHPPIRWPTGTVPFWIQKDRARERNRELVRLALAAWEDATGGTLRFEESEAFPEKGIRVFFTRDQPHFGVARPETDGETGEIRSADVIVVSEAIGDRLQRDLVVYLTALHELGHALGLGHSEKLGEIMYGFRGPSDADRTFRRYRRKLRSVEDIGTARASGITEADRRAIRALYARPPS